MRDYFSMELSEEEISKVSNLGLAHLGDAVFELMVRAWLIERGMCTSGGLHKAAVAYVNAPKQAALTAKILPLLTEEESSVFRRGRNAKVGSIPKNAEIGQYHTATALETLFGYLYLHARTERINALFKTMMEG